LYLQVNTIAEITNIQGNKIHKEAYFGISGSEGPELRKCSKSTMVWPVQSKPPERAWKVWKKMLRNIVHKGSLTLKYPLSRWITTENNQRIWENAEDKRNEQDNKISEDVRKKRKEKNWTNYIPI
jgi:hypothetical protein